MRSQKGAVDQDSNAEIFLPDWDPDATGPEPPNLHVGGAWNKLWLLFLVVLRLEQFCHYLSWSLYNALAVVWRAVRLLNDSVPPAKVV